MSKKKEEKPITRVEDNEFKNASPTAKPTGKPMTVDEVKKNEAKLLAEIDRILSEGE